MQCIISDTNFIRTRLCVQVSQKRLHTVELLRLPGHLRGLKLLRKEAQTTESYCRQKYIVVVFFFFFLLLGIHSYTN